MFDYITSEVHQYLWLVPALPLAAAAITALFGPGLLRQHSHWPCIIALAISCVVSFVVFAHLQPLTGQHGAEPIVNKSESGHDQAAGPPEAKPAFLDAYYPWITVGEGDDRVDVGFSLHADALSTMMIVMVTFIATLIAIYAAGYMHNDPGYPRFFAEVSLFVFMMTMLVLGSNLLLLYLGWEGVGLCSYLLIGFWFAKPEAAAAARKAFLVTRIGDLGLTLGILLLWSRFGHHLEFQRIFEYVQGQHAAGTLDHGMLVMACLLLLCGAMGKSAQFPLHVWLPDAMEGPTPVSALIHAATMVTAGVYLVARCSPLFELAPEAQAVVALVGGFTAIFAALIALTQNDLKRVLAYSTLSQLGYMFLALGCGIRTSHESFLTFAVVAAMFHLFTHAFFKALLFLSAGSVMHAMGNVIDMRRFGGLRRVLPRTHIGFLCGALALAGIPLLSGFWSKDEILAAAWNASQEAGSYRLLYLLVFLSGMITAFLTAFYTFRAYYMTFWGEVRVPPEALEHAHHGSHGLQHGHEHAHQHGEDHSAAHGHPPGAAPQVDVHNLPPLESPPVMTVPLLILSVFALFIGGVLGPTHLFGGFVEHTPGLRLPSAEYFNGYVMTVSSLLAIGGWALAYLMYLRQPDLPGRLATSAQGLYQLSLNKFHVDELYEALLLRPLSGFTIFTRIFDLNVLDGIVDLCGHVPRLAGYLFRPLQNGLVQFYALTMILAMTIFLFVLAAQTR